MALLVGGFVAVWAGLLLLPALRAMLFLAFFSLVLAAIISYPLGWLSRLMPRALALALTTLLVLGFFVGAGWLVAPLVANEVGVLVQRLPTAFERLASWWRELGRAGALPGPIAAQDPERIINWLQSTLGQMALGVLPYAANVMAAVGHAIAALVLAFFFAYRPLLYQEGLVALVPSNHVEGARQVLGAAAQAVRGWAAGALASMTVVGVLTAIGLSVLGIDVWLALAAIAFLGEFIPFIGPILSAVPALLIGLADSPAKAFWTGVLYLAIQQVEGLLIQPVAMRWAVRIAPALLILWQVAFATAFGLAGLLVSTPLLAALQASIQKGYVERVLGKCAEA
jgi:predicted PurR-regulated permease PerM